MPLSREKTVRRTFAGTSRLLPLLLGAALSGLLDTPVVARADDGPGGPETIVLFNGKNLEGWEKTDLYGSGTVEVKDGTIRLNASEAFSGMTGITCTRQPLPRSNYELRYEARRLGGKDFFAAATFPVGDAYLTFVNGGWGGTVTGLSSIDGADASENETSTYMEYHDDTWYRFRIRVTDKKVVCWVDDEEIVNLDHQGRHLGTRLETRPNEPLGFATWESGGALRKLEIKRLSPAEVAATNKAEK